MYIYIYYIYALCIYMYYIYMVSVASSFIHYHTTMAIRRDIPMARTQLCSKGRNKCFEE